MWSARTPPKQQLNTGDPISDKLRRNGKLKHGRIEEMGMLRTTCSAKLTRLSHVIVQSRDSTIVHVPEFEIKRWW